jgi:hypothetical protein
MAFLGVPWCYLEAANLPPIFMKKARKNAASALGRPQALIG